MGTITASSIEAEGAPTMAPIWRVDGVFDVKTTATTAKIHQDPPRLLISVERSVCPLKKDFENLGVRIRVSD